MAGKSIMIQGTTSNAGKTFVVAGLCRVFAQDGFKVAPFKSQNMSTYGFVTGNGKELSRAQAVQAEAAGTEASEYMNPILLKPVSLTESRVILNGIDRGVLPAEEYYRQRTTMKMEVMNAYRQLARSYDRIIIEGAGSPAEMNLSDDDIVNMGMAEMADAPVLLVADIDRGGVFASIYGTVQLLPTEQKKRIKGIIINKFRGDKKLLESGLKMIEKLTGIPVVGVLPMAKIVIEDEDSISSQDGFYSKESLNCADFREQQYDLLADLLRENLDMEYIKSLFQTEEYGDIPIECMSCSVAGCGGKPDPKAELGSNYIYYGTGKAKQSMAVGAALRSAATGRKVLMYSFVMANDAVEKDLSLLLNQIPMITKVAGTPAKRFLFMMSDEEKEENRAENDKKLDELAGMAKAYDVLILEEALYAIEMGVLTEDKVVNLLRRKPEHLDIILTGRKPTEKLLAMAEYASEIQKINNPFEMGINSRLGIE